MTLIIGGYDCETTGLLDPEHRIIEACVQQWSFDPTTFQRELITTDTWRINPERRIEQSAVKVHGITNDMVAKSPKWQEVAPHLVRELDKCDIVVAHNGNEFDFPFLIQECDRIKVDLPDFEPFDTMLSGRSATPFGKVPNLQELCFALDVLYDPEEAHAAEYDVRVMMHSFFRGVELGWFNLPE